MPKYHISPETGRPNICRAQNQCPLKTEDGKPAPHFNSKEEARAGVEKIEASKNSTFTKLKKPVKTQPVKEEPSIEELEELEKELEETPLEEMDFDESEVIEELKRENEVKKWKHPTETKALQNVVSDEKNLSSKKYINQISASLTPEVEDNDYYSSSDFDDYDSDSDSDYDYYQDMPKYTGYVSVDSQQMVNSYYNSIVKKDSRISYGRPDSVEARDAKKVIAKVFTKYDLFNDQKYSAIDDGFGSVSYECEADVDGAVNELRQILGAAPEEYDNELQTKLLVSDRRGT